MQSATNSEQIQQSPLQDASTEDVHLLDLLVVLSRRVKFIIRFTLGVGVLTIITVFVIPSSYTATTVILPPAQSSTASSMLASQIAGAGALASMAGSSLGIKNPSDMYVSLFHSRTVEDSVIQRFGLMGRYRAKKLSDARKAFERHIKVVLGAKDGLITIDVTDRDPNTAAQIANGYVDEFRKLTSNLAITEAAQRRVFFQQQLLEAKENLTVAEEAMKGTEQSTGVLQIDSQTRSLIESAAALRAQVVAKEVQLQSIRTFATEDNPQVLEAKQQLIALQAQLAKLAGTDQDSGPGFIVPKGKIPEAGMAYIRKLRDVKYYESISELIAKQFELAKLDEARQGATLQMVDLAVPPDRRSFPKRTITVIMAILIGFFVACGWCIAADRLKRVNSNPAEQERLEALRASFR